MINIDIKNLTEEQIHHKYRSQIKHGLEVIRYAAQGLSDAEIGPLVFLSTGAVKSRMKALFPVIGARNRVHAVAICAAHGWLGQGTMRDVLANRRFRSINGTKPGTNVSSTDLAESGDSEDHAGMQSDSE